MKNTIKLIATAGTLAASLATTQAATILALNVGEGATNGGGAAGTNQVIAGDTFYAVTTASGVSSTLGGYDVTQTFVGTFVDLRGHDYNGSSAYDAVTGTNITQGASTHVEGLAAGDYIVTVWAGIDGPSVANAVNVNGSATQGTNWIANHALAPFQFNVTLASGATDLTVTGTAGMQAIHIDSVPVPEPSSTALLGLGGLALILRCRK